MLGAVVLPSCSRRHLGPGQWQLLGRAGRALGAWGLPAALGLSVPWVPAAWGGLVPTRGRRLEL